MDYNTILNGLKRFGSNEDDICKHGTGVSINDIKENVVIAPWWEPMSLDGFGNIEYISESTFASVKVWNITNGNVEFTYIKTGIGAPVLMDVVLSLGVTKCKRIIFIGSVGSLDNDIHIGDIVVPEWSVCGDGASRYICCDKLTSNDIFGQKAYPDKKLYDIVYQNTVNICSSKNVEHHIGKNFSIDTIVAQFAHIDEILGMGCNVIEMETASAFRAAKLADISIAAIFNVSDNTVQNKSLVSGRSETEQNYRRYTKKTIIPQIILQTFESTAIL